MSLKASAQAAFRAAKAATQSLWGAATYRQHGADAAYAPSTGEVTPDFEDIEVEALVGKYKAKEGSPSEGEARILIERSSLPGVTPSESDRIVKAGQTWQILVIEDNPAESHWAFVVKRLQE